MNQAELGAKIGVTRAAITAWENGTRNPADTAISLICREFNVSEAWLRTGEGEMFPPRDALDELALLSGRFLSSAPSDFQQRFARMMFSLTPEEWALLERKARELLAQPEKED